MDILLNIALLMFVVETASNDLVVLVEGSPYNKIKIYIIQNLKN